MGIGPDALGHAASFIGPRVEPEQVVARIADLGVAQQSVCRREPPLRFIDLAGQVAVKNSAVARGERVDAALAGLPRRCRAEQIAVPGLVEQATRRRRPTKC